MAVNKKARMVGINHVALEVDDIDAALEFYGKIFDFTLRGRHDRMAFIDLGDQFINLSEKRSQVPDTLRHFGLVVDDREKVRSAVAALGAKILPGRGLDFLDPWGNHVQVVQYRDIQFSKTAEVLRAMGLAGLEKTEAALEELREKGMAPD
ncbi:hypothetical protein DESUT3_06590 [Desulfuromonas versatilis]|uniref:VOC domain-containing protein n=1 Tax=Desulfuromonas versatilis TaxID=2802975 RepID=A0ABN6DTY8_9BACT|nr:VOC family protein [Desulfuromonas versatilis]BCR03590.1 hypothetical protein DESUT3_06590 [Desulfuromonas versatilis]